MTVSKHPGQFNMAFLQEAIQLGIESADKGLGGPFGCVVVKNGMVIGRGCNCVTSRNDPTAHAEMMAIRDACKAIDSFSLAGCAVYASCEPCPMCLGAVYWARPDALFFASTRRDASAVGFDDDLIYHELALPIGERKIVTACYAVPEAQRLLDDWKNKPGRIEY